MSDAALVSVVIPYYNGAETIERAIRSIEAQTVRPAEIVVVDDGSPTPLPPLTSTIPLRVVELGRNRGIPAARNAGIRAATGPLLAFLDQDDEWARDRLERQLAVARASQAPVIVFGRLLHTGGGVRPWTWPPERAIRAMEAGGDDAMRALVRWGNAAPFVTLLVPRAVFEEDGLLDESVRGGGDDFDFVMRCVALGRPLRHDGSPAPAHAAVHHFTGRNFSAHAPRWLRDNVEIVKRQAARYPVVARHRDAALAQAYYTFGRHYDGAGDRARAKRNYRRAARLRPGWLKPRLAMAWLALPARTRRAIERLLT